MCGYNDTDVVELGAQVGNHGLRCARRAPRAVDNQVEAVTLKPVHGLHEPVQVLVGNHHEVGWGGLASAGLRPFGCVKYGRPARVLVDQGEVLAPYYIERGDARNAVGGVSRNLRDLPGYFSPGSHPVLL